MSANSAREKCRQMAPRHFESWSSVGYPSEMFGLSARVHDEKYCLVNSNKARKTNATQNKDE
jgi:hypothetical protein